VTTASIFGPSSVAATFRPDIAGTYTFKLTVTNSAGSNSANVTYTAQLFPPVAVPGKTQNAATGKFVFLNGKDSYDPNSLPITFSWTLANKPSGSALTSASIFSPTTPKPFFTPDVSGAYTLQLIVSNGTLQSTAQTVTVNAATGPLPPNANAGPARNAAVGQPVSLDGTGSFDPNLPALALTYAWTFTSVPTGSTLTNSQITAASTPQATITPDVAGAYVLHLHVTNSAGAGDDTVTVQAFAGQSHSLLTDAPPNAITGASQYVLPGGTAQLTAVQSSDPDSGPGGPAFSWWLNALPPGSAATIASPATAAPRLTTDVSGYYIPRVEDTDLFASGFSNTLITAAAKCDADANGTVNALDIAIITAAVGQAAGANDPRDPLAAGSVTAADLTYCQALINPTLPNIGSTPTSLTFTTAAGATPASQTLTVTSSGTAFTFDVSTDQTWLTAAPAVGSTSSNSISVGINSAGLAAATYSGHVIVTASGTSNSPFSILVTLVVQATSIAVNAGNPQVANVSVAFTTNLQAIVKDPSGNPVAGEMVTFTAPSTGASGTFPGASLTATAITNAAGVAAAPVFTANSTPGNYIVTATVTGAAAAASFALTNAVAGATSLGGAIGGKAGPANARIWTFEIGNNGPGSALNAQITGITFVQTAGAACTPVVTTPFPLNAGNIAPGAIANVNATINFTGCAATAAFTVTAQETANSGSATGTIVRLSQFQ
jgi:hypothetical protein